MPNKRSKGSEPQMAQTPETGAEHKKPPIEIKVGSALVKIWENQGEKGSWHNVTVANLYKDGEDWKQGQSFGRHDLQNLMSALTQANTRLQGMTVTETEGDQVTRRTFGVNGQIKQVIDRSQESES